MKRVLIVEGMFRDICSTEEMATVDKLYKEGQKGSAIVYMLKRIRNKWVEMFNKEYTKPIKNEEVLYKLSYLQKPFYATTEPRRYTRLSA